MKISELIQRLQEMQKQLGDVDVVSGTYDMYAGGDSEGEVYEVRRVQSDGVWKVYLDC